jgi:hypothetical protein
VHSYRFFDTGTIMKEIQEMLSAWAELYQQCQEMEPLLRAARDRHQKNGGPPPTQMEAEYKALVARAEAAFKGASDALKKKQAAVKPPGGA